MYGLHIRGLFFTCESFALVTKGVLSSFCFRSLFEVLLRFLCWRRWGVEEERRRCIGVYEAREVLYHNLPYCCFMGFMRVLYVRFKCVRAQDCVCCVMYFLRG